MFLSALRVLSATDDVVDVGMRPGRGSSGSWFRTLKLVDPGRGYGVGIPPANLPREGFETF